MKGLFLNSVYARLSFAGLLSVIAICFLPRIDNLLFGGSSIPGVLTIFGVGIIVTLLSALAVHTGIRSDENTPRRFVLYVLTANILYVLTRFSLEPLALYQGNLMNSLDVPINQTSVLGIVTIVSFIVYAAVFSGLFLFFKHRIHKEIPGTSQSKTRKKLLLVGIALIAGIILALTNSVLSTSFFFSLVSTEYVYIVLSTMSGQLVFFALLVTFFFFAAAFKSVSDQAIVLHDVSGVNSFFWVSICFLFFSHALWIVYFTTITALWPLRIIIPL